jgi:hypothetical protein
MSTKKPKMSAAAAKIVDLVIAHMEENMTPSEAQTMRKDLHALAVKSDRAGRRGKPSKSRKSADVRPLSRASAKTA